MRLTAVGLLTSSYVGEGKDVGYVRFTDLVSGAAIDLRAPAGDADKLKPYVGQPVELTAEFTVNQFRSKEGTNLSLELLSVLSVTPVKLSIQPVPAPASKTG